MSGASDALRAAVESARAAAAERDQQGRDAVAHLSATFGIKAEYRQGSVWLHRADVDRLKSMIPTRKHTAADSATTFAGYPLRVFEDEQPEAAVLTGCELLAKALADALEASSHPDCINADDLRGVVLDGTFDLLKVADAVVAAVHAEQDQTVRRMLERSVWSPGDPAGLIPRESADHDSYRRQVLGEWPNDEHDTGMPANLEGTVAGRMMPCSAVPVFAPELPQMERWRCCVVGCNPALDQFTAQTHATDEGHRVAKWPKRSEAGEAKATERNQTGYYDRYNRKGRES